ncbi:hypothetical protein [Sphingomonas psychrotolerans]|uniref:RHS repeat protein n=1 Tax=Sphingomonas psychrotolerans TaxID=1327635 RepID=A0A2K8MF82_9SPHN|nr:hypothetical protein [Sphingomonas psychrotolerans]ATY32548.1 hypothetical protein CVN68_11655 [Sphingomonas psychrotolerans]
MGETEIPSRLWKFADELGNVEAYNYTPQYQISEVIHPDGNKHVATYDANGDTTSYSFVSKPGSGTANATTTYAYATGCCGKPSSVTDANNNTTDFTYDPVHGGVLTATGPTPSSGAVRPVKRYAYTQRYAWVKNSAGAYVQANRPLWLVLSEKVCRTSATVGDACAAGSSDEVVVSYDYGPNAGPNNLWLRGKVVTADGASLRTCFSYDQIGNKISETSARAGLTSCP